MIERPKLTISDQGKPSYNDSRLYRPLLRLPRAAYSKNLKTTDSLMSFAIPELTTGGAVNPSPDDGFGA
jgi:hypothetical protein